MEQAARKLRMKERLTAGNGGPAVSPENPRHGMMEDREFYSHIDLESEIIELYYQTTRSWSL
jgi:hypothetical protein